LASCLKADSVKEHSRTEQTWDEATGANLKFFSYENIGGASEAGNMKERNLEPRLFEKEPGSLL
jgi:hypothetical protein